MALVYRLLFQNCFNSLIWKGPKSQWRQGMKKGLFWVFYQCKCFFSEASFSSFSAVFQNIPQKEPNFHCSKQEKRWNKVDFLVLKMDHSQSPSPQKTNILLKLMIYSFPWSVAYEGWQSMKLTIRLAISIIFDIVRAFLSSCKFDSK